MESFLVGLAWLVGTTTLIVLAGAIWFSMFPPDDDEFEPTEFDPEEPWIDDTVEVGDERKES